MTGLVMLSLVLMGVLLGGAGGADVAGGWGPWEANAEVDCCMYGGFERVTRYCNNPSPEGAGAKCTDSNSVPDVDLEERWRTCTCECSPECDTGASSFCANDTGSAAYCSCNYGLVIDPNTDLTLGPIKCIPAAEEAATTPAPKVYPTMDPETKKIMRVVQSATITWLLVCLFACLVLFFMLCNFKPDRVIHMCEEITLALTHLCIGFLSEQTDPEGLCRMVNFALQFFFLCTMTFFVLEALHTYAMVTYVVPKKGYLHTLANLGVGFGVPLLITGISFGALYDRYGTTGRHCWCSLDNPQAWAFFVPLVLIGFACTVIAEAQGQGQYRTLPDTDTSEYTSARVSQGSIMIIMPLTLTSYVLGLIAVERQNLYLYSIFSLLGTILGPVIFFFHTIGNAQIRAMLAKVFFCCPCFKGKSKYDRPPSGRRVAPKKTEPEPDEAVTAPEPAPAGAPPPGKPPTDVQDKDMDWQDLHKWVSNGKKDDIDQAGNVMFQPK